MQTRPSRPSFRRGRLALPVFCILAFQATPRPAEACTNFLVTRGASVDGSTMITYSADSHVRYGELYLRRGGTWPEGTKVALRDRGDSRPLGEIPQAAQTYNVIGFMNENQVAIGESTFGGRKELEDKTGIVDYGSLMFLAMDRARTARDAIQVIAELVAEHGYASTGESFSIGDPDEVWIMEIIGKGTDLVVDQKSNKHVNRDKGAVWVAIRIPDGHVSAHANHARITTFPLENGTTSITSRHLERLSDPRVEVVYSHDVVDFARRKGYFTGRDEEFRFADVYAPMDFGAARFCEVRVWSFFKGLCAGMDSYFDHVKGKDLANRLPLWVKPDRKVSVADLMAAKRDHLEGTELDMRLDTGAGPFGLPYRWRPLTWELEGKTYVNERATATQQTGFSYIAQMRKWLPAPVGGIMWFGVDDAASTVYMPMYCGITRVPESLAEGNGDLLAHSDTSAFWTFSKVANFSYLRYDLMSRDVRRVQQELETKYLGQVPAIDTAALSLVERDPARARELLTDYSAAVATETVRRWEELFRYLLVKYIDGNVKKERDGVFERNEWGFPKPPDHPGYPESWKRRVVEETGVKLLEPK
jgi:dipeptidase